MKKFDEFNLRSTLFLAAIIFGILFFLSACGDDDNENDAVYSDITLEMELGSQKMTLDLGEIGPLPDTGDCYLEAETQDLSGTEVEITDTEFTEDPNSDCLAFVLSLTIGSASANIPFNVYETLEDGASYKFVFKTESLSTTEPVTAEVVKL